MNQHLDLPTSALCEFLATHHFLGTISGVEVKLIMADHDQSTGCLTNSTFQLRVFNHQLQTKERIMLRKLLSVVAIMVSFASSDFIAGQETRDLRDSRVKGENEAAAKLQRMADVTEKLPAQLDPSKWTDMTTAADDLKKAVAATIQARRDVLEAINSLATDQGKQRSRLAELGKRILDREERARHEIELNEGNPVPEKLRGMVSDEADGYAKASSIVTQLDTAWSGILSSHQEEISSIRRSESMLLRMQEHAADFAELAEFGVAMEKIVPELTRTTESLNRLLDLFGELNKAAKTAVDSIPQKTKTKPDADAKVKGVSLHPATKARRGNPTTRDSLLCQID